MKYRSGASRLSVTSNLLQMDGWYAAVYSALLLKRNLSMNSGLHKSVSQPSRPSQLQGNYKMLEQNLLSLQLSCDVHRYK